MPAKASKGLQNDTKSRSSLIKILASKNIIKPCFQKVASCSVVVMKRCTTCTQDSKGVSTKNIRSSERFGAPPQTLACQLAPRIIPVASTANLRFVVRRNPCQSST
jgi:hypothetical protein